MIITVVISMLSTFASLNILVFCSKSSSTKPKQSPLAKSPGTPSGANAVTPGQKTIVVDREENDSTRTKAGNRNKSMMKEPDSVDDAFKEMAAKLANKAKEKTTGDSLMGDDDENPMANFMMPERPVVDNKTQDGTKLANIVEMEKKPKGKTPTVAPSHPPPSHPPPSHPPPPPPPQAPPVTAKERSVAKTVNSKKSEKPMVAPKKNSKKGSKIGGSKQSKMAKVSEEGARVLSVEKTQSGPEAKGEVDDTQEEKVSAESAREAPATTAMSTMKNPTVMLTVRKNSVMKEPK